MEPGSEMPKPVRSPCTLLISASYCWVRSNMLRNRNCCVSSCVDTSRRWLVPFNLATCSVRWFRLWRFVELSGSRKTPSRSTADPSDSKVLRTRMRDAGSSVGKLATKTSHLPPDPSGCFPLLTSFPDKKFVLFPCGKPIASIYALRPLWKIVTIQLTRMVADREGCLEMRG